MFRSLLFTLLLIFPVFAGAKMILLVGDSLSAGYGLEDINDGWPALLRAQLSKNHSDYQLVNDSISGETTSNGLFKFPAALKRYQPDIVIIEYGGNDGLRGLALPAMKDNLAQMIKMAQAENAEVLLVGVRLPPNYGVKYIESFQSIFTSLAEKYDIPLVDRMLLNVGGNPELMQSDGIHPNEQGQPIILENVWVGLEGLL